MPDRRGFISVWVFRHILPSQIDGQDVLTKLCGLESYDIDFFSGVMVEEPAAASDLIGQLPYAQSYADKANAAAAERGIVTSFGVVCQLEYSYEAEDVVGPVAEDPVFLGVFEWRE